MRKSLLIFICSLFVVNSRPSIGENLKPVGYLDASTINSSGIIEISGWAYDSNEPEKSITVHIYIGGPAGSSDTRLFSIEADETRQDVNTSLKISGKHGFSLRTMNPGNLRRGQNVLVYAYGIDSQKGINSHLSQSPKRFTYESYAPFGYIDSATFDRNGLSVSGWAVDPDEPEKEIDVQIYLGNKVGSKDPYFTVLSANQPRSDIASKFRIGGNHGFSGKIESRITQAESLLGTLPIFAYGINSNGNSPSLLRNSPLTPSFPAGSTQWGTASCAELVGLPSSTHSTPDEVVIETMDSGILLNASQFFDFPDTSTKTTSTLFVRITAHTSRFSAISLTPSFSSNEAAPSVTCAPLKPDLPSDRHTYVASFPFKLSRSFFDILKVKNPKFKMGTVDATVSATGIENGKTVPIDPQVTDAHFGVDLRTNSKISPTPPVAEVLNGSLKINGIFYPGTASYIATNSGLVRHRIHQSIHDFSSAGKHLYGMVFHPENLCTSPNTDCLKCSGGKVKFGLEGNDICKNSLNDREAFISKVKSDFNRQMVTITGRDPKALVLPMILLEVPKYWGLANPGETVLYRDSKDILYTDSENGWNHASLASKTWLAEQKWVLRTLITHIINSPYGDRVFGIRFGYGNAGEFNGYGYQERIPKFMDYSEPMQDSMISALPTSTLSKKGIIPSAAQRLQDTWGAFAGPNQQEVSDYYRFVSSLTAQTIIEIGKEIKESSHGKLLTGAYYGYFNHHLAWAPYHNQASGHFALSQVLDSPYINIITAPYGYGDRNRGIVFGSPWRSVQAKGKLFLVEADLATHVNESTPDNFGKAYYHGNGSTTPSESIAYYWRDLARIATSGVSAHWYDFKRTWYDFDEFRAFIHGPLKHVDSFLQKRLAAPPSVGQRTTNAEVAVIVSEASVFGLAGSQQARSYGWSLYNTLYELDESGAPWDMYLASDYLSDNFNGNYKLLIFLNPLTEAARLAAKVKDRDDHTPGRNTHVVWLYGSGLVNDQKVMTSNETPEWSTIVDESFQSSTSGVTLKFDAKSDGTPSNNPIGCIGKTAETAICSAEQENRPQGGWPLAPPSIGKIWAGELFCKGSIVSASFCSGPSGSYSFKTTSCGPTTQVAPRIYIDDPTVTGLAYFNDGKTAFGKKQFASGSKRTTHYWVMTSLLSRAILSQIYSELGIFRYTADGTTVYVGNEMVGVWRPCGGRTRIKLRTARLVRNLWNNELLKPYPISEWHTVPISGVTPQAFLYALE